MYPAPFRGQVEEARQAFEAAFEIARQAGEDAAVELGELQVAYEAFETLNQ